MKILLIGEYSNVHWTLAEGLRALGHEVTVLSNGDFWKDYPRDISLVRKPTKLGGIAYMLRLLFLLPRLRGYDVVQLVNPMFLELKAKRLFAVYNYLRRHNKAVFLGAYGMDYYWVKTCCEEMPLRYSDFNIGSTLRTNKDAEKEKKDWLHTDKERFNKLIANDCDGIIAGLYEYYVCYRPSFPDKTVFIPFPIKVENPVPSMSKQVSLPIKVFVGINKERSEYKGTDIMLAAAEDIERKYGNSMTLLKAVSVPFSEYKKMQSEADIILDQLYSYTPAMNALQAMASGVVCVGGGEEESYELLEESELRPIINVEPNYDSVYAALEQIVKHPETISKLKKQSIEYIHRHHDHIRVAQQYECFYKSKM